MTRSSRNTLLLVIFVTLALGGCSSSRKKEDLLLDELAAMDKETIFERAETLYGDKKYPDARRLFSFVYDTFPNDPLGHKAALRVADTYAVKNDLENLTEARLRYRDFANRYPNDPDRDYALLMVGHTYSARKIRPDRDLSNLHEALNAYQQLTTLYPNSDYAPEAEKRIGGLRETLAEHEWLIAEFYLRNKRWQGALWRLEYLAENYPEYSNIEHVNDEIERIEDLMAEQQEQFRKLLEKRRQSTED